MARLLEERMNRTYSSLSDLQELERDTSLVKTFLVEGHSSSDSHDSAALTAIERAFENIEHRFLSKVRITPAEEAGLTTVEAQWKREHVSIFFDHSHPRWWMLHSTSSSNSLGWLLGRIIGIDTRVDNVWIPSGFLEQISKRGSFRGLSLDFDRRGLPDDSFDEAEQPTEMLKMQLWGSKAGEVLQLLRREGFAQETTLAKIKLKYYLNGDPDLFALDDLKFDGKITARGTSFQSHIAIASQLYDRYRDAVERLERDVALRYRDSDDVDRSKGFAIYLAFSRKIGNVEGFAEALLGAKEPFRLWGIPRRLGKNFFAADAVDLHAGGRIGLELRPNSLGVFLPEGVCGNTIMRLYTNLQHHFDAQVRLTRGGDDAFEL
jgi:hypothetical protein